MFKECFLYLFLLTGAGSVSHLLERALCSLLIGNIMGLNIEFGIDNQSNCTK